ncbi:MAG: HAD family hydrolase [Lachnospiraceae bacterium]|jgi:phosphoglycolate phosphatase|nr:HAD family hydrolase [Lachnospiraceae bacterium]MDD3616916.1 HAD family hydrolase [Lachnospiraceae bacterium]
MRYKWYVFDFDYTLADSEKGIVLCFQHVFLQNGFPKGDEMAIKRTIGMELNDAFRLLLGEENPDTLKRYHQEFTQMANLEMTKNTRLYPEVIPMLKELKSAGAKVGILSSKRRVRIQESIDKYQIQDYVTRVVGMEDVTAAKPDPEGICRLMKEESIKKEELLYIGDSIIDAKTAQNVGVDFAAVTTGITTAEEFKPFPHKRIMADLSELPKFFG